MSKKVWKLGKFDKGINSHTDPKDIKEDEWAELEDVNVSKVGVAKTIGQPIQDSSVSQTQIGELIGGKGLYRFNSDNSYMPSGYGTSYHELSNTLDGGGGTKAQATFNIKSLVWLFSTRPVKGKIKFQLKVGSTAITDIFDVIHATGSGSNLLQTRPTDNTNLPLAAPTTNLFQNTGDAFTWTDLGYYDNNNPANSGIAGQICGHIPSVVPYSQYIGTTDGALANNTSYTDYNSIVVDGHYDWFTYNNWALQSSQYTESPSNTDLYFANDSYPWSAVFWDPVYLYGVTSSNDGSMYHNLNKRSLLFQKQYTATGVPDGADATGLMDMVGFYKWDGYIHWPNPPWAQSGEEGPTYGSYQNGPPQLLSESGFTVPINSNDIDKQQPYAEYEKVKLAFCSELIKQINSYSGTLQFTAQFENYTSAVHLTETPNDSIFILARVEGTTSGAITGSFTYDALSGAGVLYTGAVKLLDDRDRYGQGYLQPGWTEPIDSIIQDKSVTSSTGGGMVLSGETELIAGTAQGDKETWRLYIRGNPQSQFTIKVEFIGTGASIVDNETTIHANFPTNLIFADSLGVLINALTGYTVVENGGSSGTYGIADLATATEEYPGYYIEIQSTTAGLAYQFNMQCSWDSSFATNITAVGIEDEQLCLVNKTGTNVIGLTAKITDFRIWSKFSTTWINKFSNANITDVADNNMNKYLNWYYTDSENNDPVYYDEGNILRISESNFNLQNSLEKQINNNNIVDKIYPSYQGNMWANPSQWLGYKDISNHFGTSFSYQNNIYSVANYFIGKQAKIWAYTEPTVGGSGLSQNLDTNITTGNNITLDNNGMKILMTIGTSGGIDWTGSIKVYASVCYDDGSESLPSHHFSTAAVSGAGAFDSIETNTLKIQVLFRPESITEVKCFPDYRINGVRLYYTHSEENFSTFWNLGKIDFNRGFIKASTVDTTDVSTSLSGNESKYLWGKVSISDFGADDETNADDNITLIKQGTGTLTDGVTTADGVTTIEYFEMPKTEGFEDINGFSSQNNTLFVNYKSACIAGRRTFIGNIKVWNGYSYEYYNDRMIVSPINALDTFPYPDNILDLDISDGDEIVALTSYGDKVIQYKKKIAYILNISTGIASEFFIEERHKWKGILNKNHFCITDDGIFWVNSRGAWIYDGSELKDLFILGDSESSQQKIDRDEWKTFVTENSLVGYDAVTRDIFIVKNHTYTLAGDSDCYIFSLIVNSWTKGIKKFYNGDGKSISNIQSTGSDGKLSFLSEEVPNSDRGERH